MSAFTLRRFSCPETLKQIAPERLLLFLHPNREYLGRRGLSLPRAGAAGEIDYAGMAGVFLSPDARTPRELIDALYFVDEMSTRDEMDALLAEADRRGLRLVCGAGVSPADVAVQVWLLDRDLIERKHAEHHLTKVRSFESYQTGRCPVPQFKPPSEEALAALAADLDDWFEIKNRGRGSRVIACERDDGAWFLVRHGEPFKREESLEGTQSASVCYRPLKYDVLVYQPEIGELRINACSKGEKQLYRERFGKHLFGDEGFFPGTEKYTLEPLRRAGEASLTCADVAGIEGVTLTEVQIFYPGNPWEMVTRKSTDVFALLRARGRELPDVGRLTRATFRVKFVDCKTPRAVVVKPSNIAQYTRDDDSVPVEAWLRARGFTLAPEAEDGEQPGAILAGR